MHIHHIRSGRSCDQEIVQSVKKVVGIIATQTSLRRQAQGARPRHCMAVRQRSSGNARPAISLVGHATASDALLVGASDLARAHGLRLAMHLAPVEADVRAFLQRSGRRPVEHDLLRRWHPITLFTCVDRQDPLRGETALGGGPAPDRRAP